MAYIVGVDRNQTRMITTSLDDFHNVLRNLTLILKGWGLIDGKLIAIDGTKIRAQNSKHNCITQSDLDKK